jgi:membrane protein YdbS with pleckstrin-like domain
MSDSGRRGQQLGLLILGALAAAITLFGIIVAIVYRNWSVFALAIVIGLMAAVAVLYLYRHRFRWNNQ